jgi:hypothetical protein
MESPFDGSRDQTSRKILDTVLLRGQNLKKKTESVSEKSWFEKKRECTMSKISFKHSVLHHRQSPSDSAVWVEFGELNTAEVMN